MKSRAEKIKVLYIHHGNNPVGGSPTSLRIMIEGLNRSRFIPSIVLLRNYGARPAFNKLGVKILKLPGVWMYNHIIWAYYKLSNPIGFLLNHLRILISIWNAHRFLKHIDPDIVHLNSLTLWPILIATRRLNIPSVLHIREPIVNGYFGIRRKIISRILRKCATYIISISQADLNRINKPTIEHADVIYNFIDLKRFDQGISGEVIRQEWGISKSCYVVTFVGGINPIKGTLEYLNAALQIIQQRSNVRFVLLGSRSRFFGNLLWKRAINRVFRWSVASYFDKVLNVLKDPLLKVRVLDIGPRSDIPEVFAASDVIVFPSTVPHFARPLIEAAAMGKPSVASDLPGPQEIIIHGKTGLLVPHCNAKDLAQGILSIIDNPKKAAKMGDEAFKRAKKLFSSDINIRYIEKIYEKIFT